MIKKLFLFQMFIQQLRHASALCVSRLKNANTELFELAGHLFLIMEMIPMYFLFLPEEFTQQVNIAAFLLALVLSALFYYQYKKYEQAIYYQQMVDHLFED